MEPICVQMYARRKLYFQVANKNKIKYFTMTENELGIRQTECLHILLLRAPLNRDEKYWFSASANSGSENRTRSLAAAAAAAAAAIADGRTWPNSTLEICFE